MLYILLIQLASTSPELHGFLHGKLDHPECCEHQNGGDTHGSEDAEHVCAVSLFAGGVAPIYETFLWDKPELERPDYPILRSHACPYHQVSLPSARAPPQWV